MGSLSTLDGAGADPLPRRPKVLVVDDDFFLVRLISRTLGPRVEFIEANDGIQAVELAFRDRPDLVILDYSLPRLNGDQVCRCLRSGDSPLPCKIIVLTGNARAFSEDQARAMGADAYLTKPFSPCDLLDLVGSLLAR